MKFLSFTVLSSSFLFSDHLENFTNLFSCATKSPGKIALAFYSVNWAYDGWWVGCKQPTAHKDLEIAVANDLFLVIVSEISQSLEMIHPLPTSLDGHSHLTGVIAIRIYISSLEYCLSNCKHFCRGKNCYCVVRLDSACYARVYSLLWCMSNATFTIVLCGKYF